MESGGQHGASNAYRQGLLFALIELSRLWQESAHGTEAIERPRNRSARVRAVASRKRSPRPGVRSARTAIRTKTGQHGQRRGNAAK